MARSLTLVSLVPHGVDPGVSVPQVVGADRRLAVRSPARDGRPAAGQGRTAAEALPHAHGAQGTTLACGMQFVWCC